MGNDQRIYTIAPNDFAFLYEDCSPCFYLKIRAGVRRPQGAFPSILGRWAAAQSNYFVGRSTKDLSLSLPDGVIRVAERFVKSAPLEVPGHKSRIIIRGRIDLGLEFKDETFGLVDLKTAKPDPGLTTKYYPQLGFYCLALERPAPGVFGMRPITQVGLQVLTPTDMGAIYGVGADYGVGFTSKYMPIERDDNRTLGLLAQVLDVLDMPEPPEPNEDCTFCAYRSSK